MCNTARHVMNEVFERLREKLLYWIVVSFYQLPLKLRLWIHAHFWYHQGSLFSGAIKNAWRRKERMRHWTPRLFLYSVLKGCEEIQYVASISLFVEKNHYIRLLAQCSVLLCLTSEPGLLLELSAIKPPPAFLSSWRRLEIVIDPVG